VSTPVAIGNGAWDAKVVLGEATVHSDGSACFTVPARTPLYFQAIDEEGHVVQTMRSWTALQPGEQASCIGCHEHKNQAAPAESRVSLAMAAGPQALRPFYGPPRGFSFNREIQPILDQHCTRCHDDSARWIERMKSGTAAVRSAATEVPDEIVPAFSLRSVPVHDLTAKRRWTEAYLALTRAVAREGEGGAAYTGRPSELVNWIGAQSVPEMLPPYSSGSSRSWLLRMLREGHHKVALSREELEKLACWIDLLVPFCGDYTEANAWSADEARFYQRFVEKREAMLDLELENIRAFIRMEGEKR
jgi:hypothetical protein